MRAARSTAWLFHAGNAALGSGVVALLRLVVASAGAAALGRLLLLTAVGLGLDARHWVSLARRSRVGARSKDKVQRVLATLQAEGWRLRHSLPWQGRGDIGSVDIAPAGVAVTIETKTRNYDSRHLRSGARAGGMAVPSPAEVVPLRHIRRRLPRTYPWR